MNIAGTILSLFLPFLLTGSMVAVAVPLRAESFRADPPIPFCGWHGKGSDGKIRETRSQPVDPVNYKRSSPKAIAVPRMDLPLLPPSTGLFTGLRAVQIVSLPSSGQTGIPCNRVPVIRPPPAR